MCGQARSDCEAGVTPPSNQRSQIQGWLSPRCVGGMDTRALGHHLRVEMLNIPRTAQLGTMGQDSGGASGRKHRSKTRLNLPYSGVSVVCFRTKPFVFDQDSERRRLTAPASPSSTSTKISGGLVACQFDVRAFIVVDARSELFNSRKPYASQGKPRAPLLLRDLIEGQQPISRFPPRARRRSPGHRYRPAPSWQSLAPLER
jgi:hypothetical protein